LLKVVLGLYVLVSLEWTAKPIRSEGLVVIK